MEVVHARCAGIDISKRDAKVALRIVGGGRAGTKTTAALTQVAEELLDGSLVRIDPGRTRVRVLPSTPP